MRRLALVLLVAGAALAALAACARDVTTPVGPAIASLVIRPHARINLLAGDSLRFIVSASDSSGRPLQARAGDVTVRVSGASVVTISGHTLRATTTPGEAWLVAQAESGARDSVLVVTYLPTGTFHITLQFASDIPDTMRVMLQWAAERWEQVIVGALPPVTLNSTGGDCPMPAGEPASPPQSGIETGVRIFVGQSGEYPPGTYVEATGGPCTNRGLPSPTTILGQISLNRDKQFDSIPLGRLEYLVVHEMGHALGLVGVVQGVAPDWFDSATGTYTAPMALEGWRRLFGSPLYALHVNGGAHWDDAPLWDIMSASGSGMGIAPPITLITIGALMDLGYPATWEGAQTFP